jgi:hypothetical protein
MPRKSAGNESRKNFAELVSGNDTENVALLESKAGASALACQFGAADSTLAS